MKNFGLVTSILGCLVLAACGGGASDPVAQMPTSASVSGTVSGLPASTLLLNNAGTETIAVAADGGFSFGKRVTEGNAYNVTVLGQPNGTTCEVANGKGTVAHGVDSISNVSVMCTGGGFMTPFTVFHVGVTVSGLLPGNSVTLLNNGNDTVAASENGLFVFPLECTTATICSGRPGGYEVAVKTQPANQSCGVSNGSGAVTAPVDFVNVLVSCR
jgi:hypothetical protein